MEWPQALISTIFAVILLGVGLFMLFEVAKPQADYPDLLSEELEAQIIAERIFNSPNCLAWEEKYIDKDGVQKYLVHAGTIDLTKGNNVGIFDPNLIRGIMSGCLRASKIEVNYELIRNDGALLIESQEGFGTKRVGRFSYTRTPDDLISDYYFVKIRQQDQSFTDGRLLVEVAFYR
ncbi:MAG: hypothetical protein J4445_00475 [DPANN group archaeon]|nr:hypothetical protein [DPANN group archaeon]